MINLPAAPAVPAPNAAGAAADANLLLPPAANPVPAGAADGALAGALPGALLDGAAALAPAPFASLLDAMAIAVVAADEEAAAGGAADASPAGQQGSDNAAAAAQAVATMLPAMDQLPLAAMAAAGGTPGATPDSVAAVAAALTAPAANPAATDNAALLRQQAQASAGAAASSATSAASAEAAQRQAEAAQHQAAAQAETARATAQAEAAGAHEAALLDPRAALLAAAARPVPASGAAAAAPTPAPAAGARQPSAAAALSAALGNLQAQAADSMAAPISAKDGAALLADSQHPSSDGSALPGFRSVLAGAAAQPSAGGDTLRLNGSPEQWQQPLRAALGDRLQLQLARNDERAVIRLEPPNMGSVEISVRHSAGALQVNIAASHSEVLRQLNTIGDAVRQDLSQRQFSEVAVTVSSSGARNLADGGGQQRQQQSEQQRQPGRALDDAEAGTTTFAMLSERE